MKAWLKKNKISLLILALLTGIAVASAAFFPSTRTANISPSDGRGDRNNARRIEELPCAARLGTQK